MYDDNQGFNLKNAGLRFEIGLTSFLAVGASFQKTMLESSSQYMYLNTLKGLVFLRFSDKVILTTGMGSVTTKEKTSKTVYDALLKFDIGNELSAFMYYERNDARLILYSPFILNEKLDTDLGRGGFNYKGKSGFRASGQFTYLSISDKNEGNDVLLRLGKSFQDKYAFGYEYQYLNYSKQIPLYWSPHNFGSHCIWGEMGLLDEKKDNLSVNLGGRLGYVSEGNFVIREISGDMSYKPLPYFVLVGKVTAGSTYRFDASYNYMSAVISAYWSIY